LRRVIDSQGAGDRANRLIRRGVASRAVSAEHLHAQTVADDDVAGVAGGRRACAQPMAHVPRDPEVAADYAAKAQAYETFMQKLQQVKR
jgi:hypothetical protein